MNFWKNQEKLIKKQEKNPLEIWKLPEKHHGKSFPGVSGMIQKAIRIKNRAKEAAGLLNGTEERSSGIKKTGKGCPFPAD